MKLTVKLARVDGNRFRAWCPALPGCAVYAQSQREAKIKISQAIDGYLASLDTVLPAELAKKAISPGYTRGVA